MLRLLLFKKLNGISHSVEDNLQFQICDSFHGGIIVFLKADIPSKLPSLKPQPIEGLHIELKLCKKKWLLSCFYNHRDIILDRSNNSWISIETCKPQQAGDFIINNYFKF